MLHVNGKAFSRDERGVYMVLMAILIPVLFALGAIVIDVGNWYVHRRHLQTQVDAAALAGGQSLFGCYQDTTGANGNVEQAALDYAGDPTRRPLTTVNLQVQASQKVHAVINSPNYWSSGTPTDGTGYDYLDVSTDADSPKLGLPGRPCYNGWVDMKATDDQPTPLWGLIPLRPSPKTVARVELDTAVTVAGVLPLGLPDINPDWVAAIVVNEDAPNWQTNAFAVRKAGMLFSQTTPPSGLEGMNAYQASAIRA